MKLELKRICIISGIVGMSLLGACVLDPGVPGDSPHQQIDPATGDGWTSMHDTKPPAFDHVFGKVPVAGHAAQAGGAPGGGPASGFASGDEVDSGDGAEKCSTCHIDCGPRSCPP